MTGSESLLVQSSLRLNWSVAPNLSRFPSSRVLGFFLTKLRLQSVSPHVLHVGFLSLIVRCWKAASPCDRGNLALTRRLKTSWAVIFISTRSKVRQVHYVMGSSQAVFSGFIGNPFLHCSVQLPAGTGANTTTGQSNNVALLSATFLLGHQGENEPVGCVGCAPALSSWEEMGQTIKGATGFWSAAFAFFNQSISSPVKSACYVLITENDDAAVQLSDVAAALQWRSKRSGDSFVIMFLSCFWVRKNESGSMRKGLVWKFGEV